MSRALHATAHNPSLASFVQAWAIVISLFLIPAAISAQTSPGGSLADIARQVRAQKQGQASVETNAQQVADELSDDQNRSDDAPGGFKTYNAGDYTLWVPAPYKVSGHDDAGVDLEGPSVGSKRSLLLVGTPLVLPPGASDQAFRDSATKFSHVYALNASCTKSAAADRTAYKCSLAVANVNGIRVNGNVWLLRSANTVYPVLCAVSSDSNDRDDINNPRAASKDNASQAPDPEDQDVSGVRQKCETVFQSIRPKDGKPQPATAESQGPKATGSGPVAETLQNAAQAQVSPSSLNTPPSTVPAGYKIHRFQYCSGPQQCWDASTFVPAEAQLVSSNCKQYVFEIKVQGTTFLLMAGPAAGQCDGQGAGAADLVRWKQLADPENKRAPGTYNTVSTQTKKLDGKLATITTMHFRNGLTDWMGKRAEIESNGVTLVVGCLAPRDHFDDGYAICSTLIESLQLP